jgi:hypothetical protein
MARPTITIDTNCINVRSSLPAMTRLEHLHSDGRVEIVKTDVLDTEIPDWRGRRGRKARTKSAPLKEDIGGLVLGHSRLGHARLGSDEDPALYDQIADALFGHRLTQLHRRQVRDVMMVATHMRHKRDILVTLDKELLLRADCLGEEFGVTVLTPDECLARLEGTP